MNPENLLAATLSAAEALTLLRRLGVVATEIVTIPGLPESLRTFFSNLGEETGFNMNELALVLCAGIEEESDTEEVAAIEISCVRLN